MQNYKSHYRGDRRFEAHQDAEYAGGHRAQRLQFQRVGNHAGKERHGEAGEQEARLEEMSTAANDTNGEQDYSAHSHGDRQTLSSRKGGAHARTQQDVGCPAGAGEQREADAQRINADATPRREEYDASRGQEYPEKIESVSEADGSHAKRADELQGHRDAEGNTIKGEVEREIHSRHSQSEEGGEQQLSLRDTAESWSPQHEQDDGGKSDAEQNGAAGPQ